MAAGNWIVYNEFRLDVMEGVHNLETDTIKIQLHTTTHTPAVEADAVKADLDNEVANGNGYTTGGAAITNPQVTHSTTTATFDDDGTNVSWTGSSSGFTCRYAIMHNDTPTSPADPLICYSDLDASSITVNSGDTLTIQFNASGILTLTGATS